MHLLLVGGGHASLPLLTAAASLMRMGARVTLLNDATHLWYSGMVPEYLGGVYTRDQVTIDLERLCKAYGVCFIHDRAVRLDALAQTVTTASGRTLGCDLAAIDIGAVNPGTLAAPAIPTKPLHRIASLAAFIDGLPPDRPPSGRLSQRLAIVGGGAAGVEVALNVAARLPRTQLAVTLIEPASRLLRRMPYGAASYGHRLLTEHGVQVCFGQRVEAISEEGLVLSNGTRLDANAVLWATGSVGSPFFAEAGLPTDSRGFLRVNAHLQCEAAPWLFAAGDCAVIEGVEDLARVGVHAVKQGLTLRDNVLRVAKAVLARRDITRLRLNRFRPYPVAPLILSTGTHEGLLVAGERWRVSPAMLRLKHAVDRRWIRRYHPRNHFERLFDTVHP